MLRSRYTVVVVGIAVLSILITIAPMSVGLLNLDGTGHIWLIHFLARRGPLLAAGLALAAAVISFHALKRGELRRRWGLWSALVVTLAAGLLAYPFPGLFMKLSGIYPLDDPVVVSADEAQLDASEQVLGVKVESQPRAYPLRILNAHEIVNDRVGSTQLIATY